jgi:hypothetical protein
MRRRLLGNSHLDVATNIYNVGQTHHQKGDHDEAMILYSFLPLLRADLGKITGMLELCSNV